MLLVAVLLLAIMACSSSWDPIPPPSSSSVKAITAFSLAGVAGTITEATHTIAVAMPFGTDVTALVATFTTTGVSVKVDSTVQESGTTAHSFTSPVTYTVTAADATTQDYTVTVAVASSTVPGAPTIGTATAGNAQATVTFTAPVSDGGSAITGYTVTSSPGGLTGTGTASPIIVTGLTNETAYTFTVTATNAIGISVASSASNSVTPVTPVSTVTNSTTGKVWMDRNLGATQVATSSTDAAAYGDLYQWGRGTDGHQIRTSGTTSTLSDTDAPGNVGFILVSGLDFLYDWRSPQNDNLWQGVTGTNNPCPSGFRLPTEAELTAEMASWSSQNSAGAYASPLKFTVAGYRNFGDGSLTTVGTYGSYWSSTVNDPNSRSLYFTSSEANTGSSSRADGKSVRCIKN
jgi:uncharacterized protein (TIGR02145 family)